MQFTSKIVALVYSIVTGNRKTRILLTLLLAFLYLSLITLCILGSLVLDRLLYFPPLLLLPWNLLVAMPLFIFGFVFMWLAIIYFIRAKGTPVPLSPPTTLIQNGPYRYIRNPMLTGIFLQLFGIGFGFHSITLVFIFMPLFILFNYLELKYVEEPEMAKRFGAAYQEYKQRTAMFFPSCSVRHS